MKTIRFPALLGALLMFASHIGYAADMAEIKADALLDRARAADDSFVIVDVRTPAEFAQGHVPGAINIPVDQVANRLSELATAKDKDVVLYCRSGKRAGQAAEVLKSNGFNKLLHMEGDMPKWEAAKLPVEK
jgi:phage shock protein E